MEQHIEMFASRISVLEATVQSLEAALISNSGTVGRIFDERERLSEARLRGILDRLETVDKRLDERAEAINQVAVIASQVQALHDQINEQLAGTKSNVALALAAADKSIVIAQNTADTAIKKAEGAADKAYLESQIEGLRNALAAQMVGQKQAMEAALVAAKDALTAAMAASEKAIQKAEVASERRFESVNEFRSALNDMATRLIPRIEAEQRFNTLSEAINKLDLFKASQQAVATKTETDSRMTLALAGVVLSTLVAVASLAFNIFRSSGLH